jgi:hypothetical protein
MKERRNTKNFKDFHQKPPQASVVVGEEQRGMCALLRRKNGGTGMIGQKAKGSNALR